MPMMEAASRPARLKRFLRRVLLGALGIALGAVTLFVIANDLFRIRERANRLEAYRPASADDAEYERASRAIRQRIALLIQPRDDTTNIGGDPFARLVEAGILYGRLALLEEKRGNLAGRNRYMADGIALLRAAHHRSPTEEHIREVVAKQDANLLAQR